MAGFARRRIKHFLLGSVAAAIAGCTGGSGPLANFRKRFDDSETPTQAGIIAGDIVDADAQDEAAHLLNVRKLVLRSQQMKEAAKPPILPKKRTTLAVSGGGAYGAYCAGYLYGWTQTGTRPTFDVVTGISTGSLVAALAFIGPEMDEALKTEYTTLSSKDIYRQKNILLSLTSDSLADNTPLYERIKALATDENIEKIAAAHRAGRRLYVGTTNLDSSRPIVWDMGAIANMDSPCKRELFCKILLASAAIPGFFPPTEIPVTVDGQPFVERHVDGGISQAIFVRPPWIPPADREDPIKSSLYGSDMYLLVAGKLFADPVHVRPRALSVAGHSVSSLIYSQTRDELVRLYFATATAGINFHMSAIPDDFKAPTSATGFDPVEMTRMFNEGVCQAKCSTPWRLTPPGAYPGELPQIRAEFNLTVQPGRSNSPHGTGLEGLPSPSGIPAPPGGVTK